MTIVSSGSILKLRNPSLLLSVAHATHAEATRLIEAGEIPKYYLDSEIYVPGERKVTVDGSSYVEISRYSDGFGASLFILGDEMLLLSSNHELTPLDALEGDRPLHLERLFEGAPEEWLFVREFLDTEARFVWNQPSSVYWTVNGEWQTTELLQAMETAEPSNPLSAYAIAYSGVDETDLAYLFAHGNEQTVSPELIAAYLDEWRD